MLQTECHRRQGRSYSQLFDDEEKERDNELITNRQLQAEQPGNRNLESEQEKENG